MTSLERANSRETPRLDPVTFEVLRNAFRTSVDLMAEQLLRTCHSFIIHARDFSAALCDRNGDTVAQGSEDVAVHVGTLHFTAKAVLAAFEGDLNEGDVFVVNDPYVGGTHFNDVRVVRPIFYDHTLVGLAQCNGHWADIGGRVPGSFDITAREHFGEGLRIPPVRLWHRGTFLPDVGELIASNTRSPGDVLGDLRAQAEATRVCERDVCRLIERYGIETVLAAFDEVQDYVERIVRRRVSHLPDGQWKTEDYLDLDPNHGEGLVPVSVQLTIMGDQLMYDLSESAPAVGSFLNSTFSASFSGIVAGTKCFFPDVPLNSGFYRVFDVELGPPGSVVNAAWPTAVTGFYAGPYEKIVNAIFQLWSALLPERAIAGSFNLEYLLVGGRDLRRRGHPLFMFYDWMAGGWGGRNGKDGSSATASVFGAGHAIQSIEAQERMAPVLTTTYELVTDSGGPGEYRGGLGVEKGATLTDCEMTVMSYCCDRSRSIISGLAGGLPSSPHGLWLNADSRSPAFLGAMLSNRAVTPGDSFVRPSAGGGGYGDPLRRDAAAVLEDVLDGYVSTRRAERDYGVVLRQNNDADGAGLEVDVPNTERTRRRMRAERRGLLGADPKAVARLYRDGELDVYDVIRHYGVLLDWGTGELLPESTHQFRAMLQSRCANTWDHGG